MVSSAEGALNESTSILQRMRELAVQAGSDTNTTDDRTAMQTELNALTSEINRIGNTTEFNTQKLLNGGNVDTKVDVATIKSGAAAGTFKGGTAYTAAATSATETQAIGGTAGFVISAGTANGAMGNLNIAFTKGATAGASFDPAGTTLTITLDQLDATITATDIEALVKAASTNKPAGLDMSKFTVTGGGNIDGTTATVNETGILAGGANAITAADNAFTVPVTQLTGSTAAVAAQWKSGTITALGNNESASVKFNGVTVTINSGAAAVDAAATDGRTASVTVANGADAETIGKALKAAFEKAQGFGGAELKDFTFSEVGLTGSGKFIITDKAINGATNNALKMDVTQITGTTFALANNGLDATNIANTKGVTEVRGKYTMEITKAFEAAGMSINIGGKTFTTVASGAKASLGQINAGTDVHQQALELAQAINANSTLSAQYDTTVDAAGKLTLTEKATKATGTNAIAVANSNIVVGNKATAGIASFNVDNLVAVGGKYELDGVNIAVTDDAKDARIAQGTAVLYNADKATQTQNLMQAISANAGLNTKYDVSASSNTITLTQKTGQETMVVADAKTGTNAKDGFQAVFQIGANTGQTMTVQMNDMRSLALGISGIKASDTLTAKNGAQATLLATKQATSGSDNSKVEYTLDISSAAKATAAISIIDDATSRVSAERSNLGAYENRLQHTINNLGTSSQNITTAEARIRDVDMAQEMTNFQKNNILQQAANAMLAQANQQGQGVLSLLR